jgi:simple sugar transport system permease protein
VDDGGKDLKQLLSVAFSLLGSLILLGCFLVVMGEDLNSLTEALKYTFFNRFGLGYTLFYTTPLIFTGLSVALCFHAGLFNIGAEGQLLCGAISVVALAKVFPNLPTGLAIPLAFTVSALAGALWGFLPGFFKAWRGTHEVITTILLNFIALSFVNYLILTPFKNPESQSAETSVLPAGYRLQTLWFPTTPVNASLVVAIAIALAVYVFLFRTSFGFELRTMGQSPRAAVFSGVSISKRTMSVFVISGALAGLVATNDILGNEHKLIEGFSPGYGFTGIAVALVARNHPIGIIFSSFLFGSLQNFSRELEFFTQNISKDVSLIVQGVIIILVSTRDFWQRKKQI